MFGFFELRTANDLRAKLRRDFAKLDANKLDVDLLMNFLFTAEHMADWVLPGKKNKEARQALRDGSVYLRICSHLANGGKHFILEAKHHQSVSIMSVEGFFPEGFFPKGYLPPGYFPQFLVVVLKGEAAKQLGNKLLVTELAAHVLAFWEAYPLDMDKPLEMS